MTQKQTIVALLNERGPEGIKNYEFPQHFILNYKARLDELREDGYNIKTIRVKDNVWKYVLENTRPVKQSWQAKRKLEQTKEMEERGQGRLI